MSERVKTTGSCIARKLGGSSTVVGLAAGVHRGVGLPEFLIALLIFSTGMMGLLAAQLAGRSVGYDANQRSLATALARDILERMRANPGNIGNYTIGDIGDVKRRLPKPAADCNASRCSTQQLAAFDLWQWESLLVGESEWYTGGIAGGLLLPRACIKSDGGLVNIAITWLGTTTGGKVPVSDCDPEADPEENGTQRRHQLAISTFIEVRE